jgi:hypothetical protein
LYDGWLSSNYHSLQLSLDRRLRADFLCGAYTFSKAIDYEDGEPGTGLLWNDPALFSRKSGGGWLSAGRLLRFAGIYELPFRQGDGWSLA